MPLPIDPVSMERRSTGPRLPELLLSDLLLAGPVLIDPVSMLPGPRPAQSLSRLVCSLRLPQVPGLPPRYWRLVQVLQAASPWRCFDPVGGVPGCLTDAASPKRAH